MYTYFDINIHGTDSYHWGSGNNPPFHAFFQLGGSRLIYSHVSPIIQRNVSTALLKQKTTHPAVELLWHKATQQDSIAHHLCHLCKRKRQSG